MKLKILAVITAIALVGAYQHTHSREYVVNGYKINIDKACNGDPLCLVGASMLEEPTVTCLQNKFFSTSEQSTYDCLVKVLTERNTKSQEQK